MELDPVRSVALVVAGLVLLGLVGFLALAAAVAWGERRTAGLRYFGLPRASRERYRRGLRRQATVLAPMIRLVARASPFSFEKASFEHGGVAGPRGTCTAASFRAGAGYEPSPDDVFVVTQMRSGTTWMQHLVYEILMRGGGDLVDRGRTLNGVSPWLESVIGVPIGEAPTLGRERPSRLIKTHFPVSLCPYSAGARYVYVVRHPVSCFASCVDFLIDDLGPSAPPLDDFEAWFCSPGRMWWGSWPSHVDGWWTRSVEEDNVLFVRFEAMLDDLPGIVEDVVRFLDMRPLSETEAGAVCGKAGFEYMRRHREAFEMYPPHILAVDSSYLARGTSARHRDVPAEVRGRILDWCGRELQGSGFPLERLYGADADQGRGDAPPRSSSLRPSASTPRTSR